MSVSHRKPSAGVRRDDVHWNIETEREDDGRWIAEIAAVPGVIVYGATEDEAKRKAYALALRIAENGNYPQAKITDSLSC